MGFILHMIKFWMLVIAIICFIFWPAMAFEGARGIGAMLAWILFVFISAMGVCFYFDNQPPASEKE